MKKYHMTFRILEALTGLYECRSYEDWTGDYYSASEADATIEDLKDQCDRHEETIAGLENALAAMKESRGVE
jgi:hypothetical protein